MVTNAFQPEPGFIVSSARFSRTPAFCADQTPSTIDRWGGEKRWKRPIIMDKEPATQHWLIKATAFLRQLRRRESVLSVDDGERSQDLAAADELQVATWDATLWMTVNACPDVECGRRVALMLNTYAEVALTAQRAIADPSADTEAVIGRLSHLLAVIDFQSQTLDAR